MQQNMYIRAHVTPQAKQYKLEELSDGKFSVAVKAPATQNQANEEVLNLFSDHYNVPRARLRIINGHRRPNKLIELVE